MRAGDGADGQDDGDQGGAGRRGILEQLEAGVARAEVLRGDARADHGDQQQGGADELRRHASTELAAEDAVARPLRLARPGFASETDVLMGDSRFGHDRRGAIIGNRIVVGAIIGNRIVRGNRRHPIVSGAISRQPHRQRRISATASSRRIMNRR